MVLPRIVEPFLADGTDPNASRFHTSVASSSIIVIPTVARLFIIRAIVNTAVDTDRIIMAFDSAVLPPNGTAADWEMFIPANEGFAEAGDDFEPVRGLAFANGIVLASSITPGVLTLGPADVFFFGTFVG